MENIRNKILTIMPILLIAIFMIAIVPKEFQNDTFFTIVLGNNVLENGIEKEEKLVWHEGLEYTNSRWLFDIIISTIYNIYDLLGVYIFTILISIIQAILYYYIINQISKSKIVSLILTIITMYECTYEFTARAQIVSFTLFLLEFYCIESLLNTNKKRYFIILCIIPILLANMHASVFPVYFVFYLPYIVEFILSKIKYFNMESRFIINKNINIKVIIILIIIGIISGFITPDGIEPYTDMFKGTSKIATQVILELQPMNIEKAEYYFLAIICTFLGILILTNTKIKITDIFYVLGFFLMAIYAVRCVFFFYLFATICVLRIVINLLKEYNKTISFNLINKKTIYIITIIILIALFIYSIKLFCFKLNKSYISTEYPIDATNYIIENIDISDMKIFNHFNFGSYLEFRGIKAFIDSRSGIYTPEFNEGVTILSDWRDALVGAENYKTIFDKYEITHALLYNTELINLYIWDDPNWKLLYQDDNFSFYEKVQ